MNFDKLRDFQDYLVSWRVPGNDCLVRVNHENVYRYQTGYANMETGQKIQGDELYFMWSASKPITCTLALMLYECGRIHLNDPLYEYLPEYKDVLLETTDETGSQKLIKPQNPILVKHLFNMSAGFTYSLNTPAVQAVKESTGGRCPTREVVRAFAQSPLQFEPGTDWQYSICHDILAGMIEVVAGMSLRKYAKKMLFDPLEMHDTSYNLPEEDKLSRMPVQYNYRDDLEKALPTNNSCMHILGPDYDSGGAGIVSTLEDYMEFADAMANGGKAKNGERVLSESTISLMRTDFLSEKQHRSFSWPQLAGYGYGLGVRTMVDPAAAGANASIGEFGWCGAAGTYVVLDAERKIALVYTQHMLNSQEEYFAPRIRNILYACLDD